MRLAKIWPTALGSTIVSSAGWAIILSNAWQRILQVLESIHGIHEIVFGFHRKLSARFPYAIYYLVMPTHVEVVAILDCRRDPVAISTRLGQTKR